MCGIAGIFSISGKNFSDTLSLHKMAEAMSHRGPDDEGYLIGNDKEIRIFKGKDTPHFEGMIPYYPKEPIDSAYGIHATLFLAHRRLSIIDLSPFGHQPMCTKDKRYWIVYNGELYNYKELREELKKDGIGFISTSDTEVALYAYVKWGKDALKKFNGMFAFAIWDSKKKTLFCARDRIGIKPFYYTIANGRFIFASEISAIIAGGIYKPDVDIEGLYHCMSFGVAPRPMTVFKGIKALEQAHWMEISASGGIERGRYWHIPTGMQRPEMKEEEAVELIEETLKKAIKRRLIADVPVGTFMSGGIDSTTVSAIASKFHPGIKAFTLSFSQIKELDEVQQAKATADMYPMVHLVKDIDIDSVIDYVEDIIACYEEPFYELSPNYVISNFVSENGIKVVLNGLGGDELFGGYSYYRWIGIWKILRRASILLKLFSNCPLNNLLSKNIDIRRSLEVLETSSPVDFHTSMLSKVPESVKKQLFNIQLENKPKTIEKLKELYLREDIGFSNDMEALSYMDIMNYIGNHHVYRVDRFTMRFSVEARLPFLDHEMVEAAFSVPWQYKVFKGEQKYVEKKVASKYIHPSCIKMKKRGFSFPTKRWMQGSLSTFVNEAIQRLLKREVFNSNYLREIYKCWVAKKYNYRLIWMLVSIEKWFERFIDNGKGTSN